MRRAIAAAAAAGLLVGIGTTGVGLALTHDPPGATTSRSMMGRGTSMTGTYGHDWRSATSESAWLREMVAHHREAISAAGELARSDRPVMRAFGRRIVADQTAQVQEMESWLAAWYPDEADDDPSYEPMMRDLSGLSGDRLDRAFLQDMVGHHMVAVMMAQQLLVRGTAAHDEVADLARTIRDDQSREIAWMGRRLSAWWGDSSRGWCGMPGGMHGGMGGGMRGWMRG